MRLADLEPTPATVTVVPLGLSIEMDQAINAGGVKGSLFGFAKDNAQSVKYLLKAAELGHAQAMFNLSQMYLGGIGVKKDEKKSDEWLKKAAAAGNQMAREWIEEQEK